MTAIALYVQQGESKYRSYFETNLFELHRGFRKRGMDLVFLPAVGVQTLSRNRTADFGDGLRKYLEVYYPSFQQLTKKQQQQVLFILAKSFSEFEIYDELKQLFGLQLKEGAYLFHIKPGNFAFERLDEEVDPADFLKNYITDPNQHKSQAYQLDPYYLEEFHSNSQAWDPAEVTGVVANSSIDTTGVKESLPILLTQAETPAVIDSLEDSISLSPELIRLLDTVQALELQQGVTDLLDAVLHIVPQIASNSSPESVKSADNNTTTHSVLMSLSTILQSQEGRALSDEFINHAKPQEVTNNLQLGAGNSDLDSELAADGEQPMPYLKRLSKLIVTQDCRLFMMDLDKPIKLDPLHRALYLLFLNHPEGIELQRISEHYEELFSWYKKTATHESLEILKDRVMALCNPLENSVYEKISRINRVIKNLAGEENANSYIITGERFMPKKVHLRGEMIVWLNRFPLA